VKDRRSVGRVYDCEERATTGAKSTSGKNPQKNIAHGQMSGGTGSQRCGGFRGEECGGWGGEYGGAGGRSQYERALSSHCSVVRHSSGLRRGERGRGCTVVGRRPWRPTGAFLYNPWGGGGLLEINPLL